MDLQNRKGDILTAWRALANDSKREGWCTIDIDGQGLCKAGFNLADKKEAILFSFEGAPPFFGQQLPHGYGFSISPVSLPYPLDAKTWLALVRSSHGNLEMFTLMAVDIMATMEKCIRSQGREVYELFLSRVRAWQTFMRSKDKLVLGHEDEIGLFGELLFLQSLMTSGLTVKMAINAWKGPSGAVHDFSIGTGATEVKTTATAGSFLAHISSLHQLEDKTVSPLYLCAIRLDIDGEGITLPVLVELVADHFRNDDAIKTIFDNCLISAGFTSHLAHCYSRGFSHVSTILYHIDSAFPRLIPSNVSPAITKANYYINLDNVNPSQLPLSGIIRSMGVLP